MAGSFRPERLSALIRSELARLWVEEVSDPHLKDIAITEVRVSKDLKNAFVYFEKRSTDSKKLRSGMARAIPFIKRRLGEELSLRYVPDLHFEVDSHTEEVSRLMDLFKGIKGEDGLSRQGNGS